MALQNNWRLKLGYTEHYFKNKCTSRMMSWRPPQCIEGFCPSFDRNNQNLLYLTRSPVWSQSSAAWTPQQSYDPEKDCVYTTKTKGEHSITRLSVSVPHEHVCACTRECMHVCGSKLASRWELNAFNNQSQIILESWDIWIFTHVMKVTAQTWVRFRSGVGVHSWYLK